MIFQNIIERPKLYFIIVIFSILFIIGGLVKTARSLPLFSLYQNIKAGGMYAESDNVYIDEVMPSSPADEAQLNAGDMIISSNGMDIRKASDFTDIVRKNGGKSLDIVLERNGEIKQVQLFPKVDSIRGGGYAGVATSNTKLLKEPLYKLIPKTVLQNISWNVFAAPVPENQLVGPVGITERLSLQKDYFRPFNFALGMIFIILAIGLLKLRRWSLYGIYVLTFLNLPEMIIYFPSIAHAEYSFAFSIISFTISILFVYYLYSQRKFFA